MKLITCPLCGYRFDPSGRVACPTCPIHDHCNLVCCPNCGHTTIDPNQSRIARWVARFFSREKQDEAASS